MSFNPISSINNHPDDYLLQIKTVKGQKQLGVLKKGMWTWLKIHIGPHLGLFDRNSVKLSEIAKYIMEQKDIPGVKNPKDFYDVVDCKIMHWNDLHPKIQPIPTKNPHPNSNIFTFQKPSTFHAWLEKSNEQTSEEVIQKLQHSGFSSVASRHVPVSNLPTSFQVMFKPKVPAENGCMIFIRSAPSIFKKSIEFPSLEKIASYLNGEMPVGIREFKKVVSQGKDLCLAFFTDETGACQVKISLIKPKTEKVEFFK